MALALWVLIWPWNEHTKLKDKENFVCSRNQREMGSEDFMPSDR